MKKYGCIAEMEKDIQEGTEEIKTGSIGYFGGREIVIKGKILTKGYFPRLCVRWISGEGKGLFGKGLIGYSGHPISQDRIRRLPTVK